MERPILSLAEIDAFDPQGPPTRKLCPLCGDSKPKDGAHRSLSIQRENGLWKCFRCGSSGQAREFWKSGQGQEAAFSRRERASRALQETFRLPPRPFEWSRTNPLTDPPDEQGRALDSTEKVEAKQESASAETLKWRAIWDEAKPLQSQKDGADCIHTDCEAAIAYLKGRRGIEAEAWQSADVRFHSSWLGGAVVFPLCDRRGEVCAIQGRSVRGSAKITHGPKKEAAFAAPVTLTTLGQLSPLDKRTPVIVLVEAPIDALSLSSCGFPSLALCGTSGPSWLHFACGLREVVLAFDADEAGEKASRAIEERLAPYGARCRRLKPEGFKDWNECLISWGRENLEAWLLTRLV